MGEHYFTAEPASDAQRRRLTVRLAGRDVEVEVAGGVFSPGAVDRGTAVLLEEAPPPPPEGVFLDLGCGWGPLALSLGLRSPAATVWALDVNARALDLCRRNAAALGLGRVHAVTAEQLPADARFDVIWSNPPIRVGKAVLHDLLRTWLPRLAPDGVAHLVVQKNLGADSLQRWVDGELGMPCARTASSKGFRVLQVRRPG
ncbi:methyltransferase [Phycicoccus endophyticus]|uniref:Methyltransferase n=1 Tax=Phycicoccus endophyticus TaxID=1690220 RepID=A0A7G9R3T6_9MICO|nr:methyltransferase [Phycicoccus endophyticus]NHI18089.1 methyltransferase [Phycicoccus endophyticus]QNN50261.1 methyltransferase [Phycicoccus endophyticus]GGL26550.1 16S RNA G1207 methylase RsmC [Phycicoccus endophyticus]